MRGELTANGTTGPGSVEPKCDLERMTLDKLQERGWEVIGGRRHRLDLDLSVGLAGTPGLVRFRNAFAGDVTRGAEPFPIFIRIDLGEPAEVPWRWALWDRYRFPGGRYAPSYCALVVHEAIGENWASVAACSVTGDSAWYSRDEALDAMLSRAEALCPGRDETSRRSAIFGAQRENASAQWHRGKDLVIAGVFSFLCLVFTAAAIHVGVQPTDIQAKKMLAVGMCTLLALVCSIPGLVLFVRRSQRPRQPLEGMTAVVEMLQESGAFTTFALSPHKRRDGLPVVVRNQRSTYDDRAPLSVSRLTASSFAHPISLEADLCRVAFPAAVAPEARIVPERWLTIDLSGDHTALAKVPRGPREERRNGIVRWTFTGEELDAGEAAEQFRKLAASFATPAGPYR